MPTIKDMLDQKPTCQSLLLTYSTLYIGSDASPDISAPSLFQNPDKWITPIIVFLKSLDIRSTHSVKDGSTKTDLGMIQVADFSRIGYCISDFDKTSDLELKSVFWITRKPDKAEIALIWIIVRKRSDSFAAWHDVVINSHIDSSRQGSNGALNVY